MRLLEIQNMEYGIRNTEPGPKSSPWREDHCELVRGEIHGEPREYVFSDLYGCQWGRNPWVALRNPSVQIHMDVRFRHPSHVRGRQCVGVPFVHFWVDFGGRIGAVAAEPEGVRSAICQQLSKYWKISWGLIGPLSIGSTYCNLFGGP